MLIVLCMDETVQFVASVLLDNEEMNVFKIKARITGLLLEAIKMEENGTKAQGKNA